MAPWPTARKASLLTAVAGRTCAYINDMSEIPPDEASAETAAAKIDAEAEAEAKIDAEAEAASSLAPEAEGEL